VLFLPPAGRSSQRDRECSIEEAAPGDGSGGEQAGGREERYRPERIPVNSAIADAVVDCPTTAAMNATIAASLPGPDETALAAANAGTSANTNAWRRSTRLTPTPPRRSCVETQRANRRRPPGVACAVPAHAGSNIRRDCRGARGREKL